LPAENSDVAGAPRADRVMKARRESACADCGAPVRVGQRIARCGNAWIHLSCAVKRPEAATGTDTEQ
jgi:hypothetical protein